MSTPYEHTSMARKQASNKPSTSKSPAKMEKNRRSKTKNTSNGCTSSKDDETEILAVSSPSSDEEEDAGEVAVEEASDNEDDEEELVVEDNDDEQVEEDAVAAVAEVKSKKKEGLNKTKKKKNSKDNCNGAIDEHSSLYRFPMQRVSRIIKSEDPGIRITQEAVFAINKASEMFLQLFSMEAYACAFLDRKKFVAYKHLSSVVTKRKRFDFLSDFVPEKLKAEDALKDIPSMDTS